MKATQTKFHREQGHARRLLSGQNHHCTSFDVSYHQLDSSLPNREAVVTSVHAHENDEEFVHPLKDQKSLIDSNICSLCSSELKCLSHSLSTIPGKTIHRFNYANPSFCQKCLRNSTSSFDIDLQNKDSIDVGRISRRIYGCKITQESTGSICHDCSRYVDGENSNSFAFAWPSILCTVFRSNVIPMDVLRNIIKCLPLSIVECYLGQWENFSEHFRSIVANVEFNVLDVTVEQREAISHLESRKAFYLKETSNKEALPRIRCPWGCWEFLEKCEKLPFKHLLKKFWPNFNSFNTNNNSMFEGILHDYTKSEKFLDKFMIQPACVIDKNEGLCVLVCSKHKKGSDVH